jgi:S1-C subfamily serine protease
MTDTSRRRLLLAGLGASLAGARGAATAASSLPEVVQRVKPSILLVGTFRATDSPRFGFRGTGFVVGDGLTVLTCAHVLPERWQSLPADGLAVQQPRPREPGGGEPRTARVVAVDAARDLAVLRLEGAPLPALPLAEPQRVREGMAIALMGFPIGGLLGFAPVTHAGIVSSITPFVLPPPSAGQLTGRAVRQLRGEPLDILQLDAIAYPGNSGGPVFDAETGEVVGVVNMVLRLTRESALAQPTGLTYAIPISYARELLQRR